MKKRSKATISYMMSRIKGKNTGIEIKLRKELTKRGLHYRHNTPHVFGHPDVSFKKYKIAVFCDSEFWHGYHFETNDKQLKSHRSYWIPKIKHNIARDQQVNAELAQKGYVVLRFWGREIGDDVSKCADQIEAALASRGYSKK
jgi:DNA mismatch endonuclease (patch repair protein)